MEKKQTGKKVFVIDFRSRNDRTDPLVIYEAWATYWQHPHNLVLRRGKTCQPPLRLDAPLILIGYNKGKTKQAMFEWAKGSSKSKKHIQKVNWVGGEGFPYRNKMGREKGNYLRPFAVPLLCSVVGSGAQIMELQKDTYPEAPNIPKPKRASDCRGSTLPPSYEYRLIFPPNEVILDFEQEESPAICLESIVEAAMGRFVLSRGGKSEYEPMEFIASRFMLLQLLAHRISIKRFTTKNLRQTLSEKVIVETAQRLVTRQSNFHLDTQRQPPDMVCTTEDGSSYSWNQFMPGVSLDEITIDKLRESDHPVNVCELAQRYLQKYREDNGVNAVLVEITTTTEKQVRVWASKDAPPEICNSTGDEDELFPADIRSVAAECFGKDTYRAFWRRSIAI